MKCLACVGFILGLICGVVRVIAQTTLPDTQFMDAVKQAKMQIAVREAILKDPLVYGKVARLLALLCQSDQFYFTKEPVFAPAWTPPEILKLDPAEVIITADGARVEFGGGFHHFGYELKPYPYPGGWDDTKSRWMLTYYSEGNPTLSATSITLNKTDHVVREDFVKGAMVEFGRRTKGSLVESKDVTERLAFLTKFNEPEIARKSVRDCAAANSNDWLDQLLSFMIDARDNSDAKTQLDAWAHNKNDFSAWLLTAYAYNEAGDHDSAERSTKLALTLPVDDPDWFTFNPRYPGATMCAQLLKNGRYATCIQLCEALLSYHGSGDYLAPQIASIRDLARQTASTGGSPPTPPAFDDGSAFTPFKGLDLAWLANGKATSR